MNYQNLSQMKKLTLSLLFIANLYTWLPAQVQQSSNEDILQPRMRVIIDNDFGGDPDGLFHLVHQILSPSTEIRGIIGSFIKGFFEESITAASACNEANALLKVMDLEHKFPVHEGANAGLVDLKTPQISAGAMAIIKEAMREDTQLPLYILCGAGLTDIASAYLIEPRIAKRLTLVWIGGPEYTELAVPPPGNPSPEYNTGIDIKAAQVIFNRSDISVWQIPRNTYRQALVSYAELLNRVKPYGPVGEYLTKKIEFVMRLAVKHNFSIGEVYDMGDSPLVLLTALQSGFDADPSSSDYILKPAPIITENGNYEINSTARMIRIYTHVDTRLIFEDFFAKLSLLY